MTAVEPPPASALACFANKNIICAKKDDLHEMKTLALALTDPPHQLFPKF